MARLPILDSHDRIVLQFSTKATIGVVRSPELMSIIIALLLPVLNLYQADDTMLPPQNVAKGISTLHPLTQTVLMESGKLIFVEKIQSVLLLQGICPVNFELKAKLKKQRQRKGKRNFM